MSTITKTQGDLVPECKSHAKIFANWAYKTACTSVLYYECLRILGTCTLEIRELKRKEQSKSKFAFFKLQTLLFVVNNAKFLLCFNFGHYNIYSYLAGFN